MPGSTNSSAPASIDTQMGSGNTGKCHSASGNCASHSSAGQTQCSKDAAAKQYRGAGRNPDCGEQRARSTSGTMTSVNNGTATALASGETSETLPNATMSAGIRPTVTASCTRAKFLTCPSRERLPEMPSRMTATAPNDSHAPAASGANGSISSTTRAMRVPLRGRHSVHGATHVRRRQCRA